ncbi:Thiosulfate sulfurtransferase, rhodanese [Rhodopirellula islandica]|uniref:Thiosulfate sulfurtransferase, rhodanese n=1 Tax=Rhodopirellula islandica TaxID=595434 RepID=A0A0J1B7H7_RHOIS|nr:thioredoxin domain-containing protein [Rhodopirellula islandica]KLU02518.1 Thiosulfate sulfurtransferase, rhodanese [Rhodopirellula islandica]
MPSISRPASLAVTSITAAFIGLVSLFFIGCNGPSNSVPPANIPADAIQQVVGSADNESLVLVKFGAPWCGPCRQVDKEIASLASTLPKDVHVVTVDVDERPEVAAKFGIQGIPRMFLVRNGEVLADEVGYRSESELRNWVASYQ